MKDLFSEFDLRGFWHDYEYARTEYQDAPPTDDQVAYIESALGYSLPASYISLATRQNGGMPARESHPMSERTSWALDHVAVNGIFSIGRIKRYSLCGAAGSRFWIDEWGYPAIGVYFADCPSAGHDMFCLDYRDCGVTGEPKVVHVDQQSDFRITVVAANFESFARGLVESSAFRGQ